MVRNIISVIDGEAGSCGKAKVVGEIATDENIKVGASITNCMPNAGHSFTFPDGRKIVFRNIPVACVNPNTELFIGPGSAIDMEVFSEEYDKVKDLLGDRKIYVHEMVPLIEKKHKDEERIRIKTGSTFKGCGAVSKDKIMRDKELQFFKTFKNAVRCGNSEWLERLYSHLDDPYEYVLLEGAQGCDLSLNHGGEYPYCTSRNVSTAQMLADSGISAERLLQTIMVIRPFPIRISNVTNSGDVIYSGGYGSGAPLTWSQVNIASMLGQYPFPGDLDCYHSDWSVSYIKKLLAHSSITYLKQLFGNDFRKISPEKVDLVQAMELERLYFKNKGQDVYESRIIELPMIDSDFSENTIFDQSEQTSVTKMERRIFDLDINKLRNNAMINSPSGIYLNFFQHLDREYRHCKGDFDDYYFNRYIREYFEFLESNVSEAARCESRIIALGTGEVNGERILRKDFYHKISA